MGVFGEQTGIADPFDKPRRRKAAMIDRQRSQILGIMVLAFIILLIAMIRYYFRLA